MPFGKFRGVLIADLGDDYLSWLRGLGDLREPLRGAVETEWDFRFGARAANSPIPPEVRAMAAELVSAGYRKVASVHHPDHGGDSRAMVAINAAVDWLRRVVRTT